MSQNLEDQEFTHLSWEDVEELTIALSEKIKRVGFKPDIIVAVSRGGFDPARILCDQLLIRRLASLQVEYYEGVNVGEEPEIVIPLNADVIGLDVLLVDDVSDSGESLNLALEHLKEKGSEEVRVATLHCKPWSDFEPDFFVERVTSWIVYPWELKETIRNIARKLSEDTADTSEIINKLENMGFKTKDIERYFLGK